MHTTWDVFFCIIIIILHHALYMSPNCVMHSMNTCGDRFLQPIYTVACTEHNIVDSEPVIVCMVRWIYRRKRMVLRFP